MSLRAKLIVFLVTLFTLLAVALSFAQAWWVQRLVINHASDRLRQHINVAWMALESDQLRLETIADLLTGNGPNGGLQSLSPDSIADLLEKTRLRAGVDLLAVLDREGRLLHGSGMTSKVAPEHFGLSPLDEGGASGYAVLPAEALSPDMRPAGGDAMIVFAARRFPESPDAPKAVLIAGDVLNNAQDLLDDIQNAIFGDATYRGKRAGSVTIFLGPTRIATTVLLDSGRRAVGTTASERVAEQVLAGGKPWTGRALVLDDWHLSRYEPIRDASGAIIGMLYIGEQEQIYLDQRRETMLTLVAVLVIILTLAFAVSFYARDRMLRQIVALDETTCAFAAGDRSARVVIASNDEIGELAQNFNRMAEAIETDHARIVAQNEEIQTLNSNYMQMLGFVTHELRSTISAALFNAQLLQGGSYGELTGDLREGLAHVLNSLIYLDEITNNYLQLARIEEGALVINKTEVHVAPDVIRPVLAGLDIQLQRRNMTCRTEVSDDLAAPADVNLLRVVYENLVGNAIKYGRDGGRIVLSGERADGSVLLRVWNDGKAIGQERLPSLFRKFERYDTDETTGRQGTGLGLFIVKQIVSVHGGEIWVESSEEKGTCFHLRLPA